MTPEPHSDESPDGIDDRLTLGIVGVGLLGGSVALAAKRAGLARRVIGVGRNPERLQSAVDAGIIDEFFVELPHQVEWDLVVVCTPVDRLADDVLRIAAVSPTGTLITDVGSVKGCICDAVQEAGLPLGIQFTGAHPLAGSEKTGFEAARADLFDGRMTVVTPRCGSADESDSRDHGNTIAARSFWESLGSQVVEMTPREHDDALATTSHLPHVAAAALAAALPESCRPLTATGFRDTTRIAAGDPDLWVAILLENAAAVSTSLDQFSESFEQFRHAIQNRDAGELKKLLQIAKRTRDSL